MNPVYTIGHSNYDFDKFLLLLRQSQIQTLIDVRSNPNSTWASFANRDNLKNLFQRTGINYIYMGDTLGGKPLDKESLNYQSGKVDYTALQKSPSFGQSITKLIAYSETNKVCLMCAEENPIHCHRSLLIGSALVNSDIKVMHIRGDGRAQTDDEISKERAGVPSNQQRLSL